MINDIVDTGMLLTKYNILLVESNPEFVTIIKKHLNNSGALCELFIAGSSKKTVELLSQWKNNCKNQLPDIILLDVNLSNNGGNKILSTITNDNTLKKIPVVIFTTAEVEKEMYISGIKNEAELTINPSTFKDLLKYIETIDAFLPLIANK